MASPALTAPVAPALTGAALCAVSFAASARAQAVPATPVLQIKLPKLPNINLPDLNIDLPNKLPSLPSLPSLPGLPKFGGKKDDSSSPKTEAKGKSNVSVKVSPKKGSSEQLPGSSIKVRASGAVRARNPDAPSVGALPGKSLSIPSGDGYQRFPSRRMPGANMEGWKKIAGNMSSKK